MQEHISFFLLLFASLNISGELPEMILGNEKIRPGINLVFEGAIKDDVFPSSVFGSEEDSDIHLEVLANWSEDAPSGSPEGGFVAYLRIEAVITNQGSLKTADPLAGWSCAQPCYQPGEYQSARFSAQSII